MIAAPYGSRLCPRSAQGMGGSAFALALQSIALVLLPVCGQLKRQFFRPTADIGGVIRVKIAGGMLGGQLADEALVAFVRREKPGIELAAVHHRNVEILVREE